MNAKKILFPTDFSHTGDAALAIAASLAKEHDGQLLIVHVPDPSLWYGEREPTTEQLTKMLHNIKPTDSSISVAYCLVKGDPVDALVQFAKEERIDLIVLGSHGHRGLTRMLLGSVAEGIVRQAPCPVLVCKPAVGKPAAVEA